MPARKAMGTMRFLFLLAEMWRRAKAFWHVPSRGEHSQRIDALQAATRPTKAEDQGAQSEHYDKPSGQTRSTKPTNRGATRDREEGQARKGDPDLLGDKTDVSFRTAEQYLGIADRQRQYLIAKGILKVVGGGHNRKITTESLRKYLPPQEKPK